MSQRDMAKASSSTRVDPLPSFEWSLLPYLLALVAGVFAIEATRQWWRETEWRRELRRCQSGADEHQRPIPLLGDTHPFQRDNLIAHTPTLQRSLARH